MQTLKGEKLVVTALFEKIRHDQRHHHVMTLIHEPIQRRDYASSAMAFRDLDASKLRKVPGYSDFLNTPPNEELLVPGQLQEPTTDAAFQGEHPLNPPCS